MKKHFSEFWYMYVLGVVLALMIIGYCRLHDLVQDTADGIISAYHLTDMASEDIIEISYRGNKKQEISFAKKEDGTWVYIPDENLAIEQAGPQYLAELLKKVTGEYQIDNVEDIGMYGLSEESPYVEVVTKTDTCRIYIGNYNDIVKRYYAYIDGSTTVYGIKKEVAEILDYTLESYLIKGDF